MTTDYYPPEFFLGNLIELEPGREQKFPTCWAYAVASLIGDTLSLQENILPIIPSTTWIISMHNHVCKKYYSDDLRCNKPTFGGYSPLEILHYMSRNSTEFYAKLEKCFSENDTVNFIEFENFIKSAINIPIQNIIIDYLGYMYPNCCLKENAGIIQCQKPTDILSNLQCKFNIKVKFLKYINFFEKGKDNITDNELKYFQDNIKYVLFCRKRPLISAIIATNDYIKFMKEEVSKGNTYFIPDTEIFSKEDMIILGIQNVKHAIVIYGWETKDGVEYWIVRDSNITKYGYTFYKIPFSTIKNRDYWIGCDIDWILDNKFRVNSFTSFIDVEVDEDSLLRMIAHQQVEIK